MSAEETPLQRIARQIAEAPEPAPRPTLATESGPAFRPVHEAQNLPQQAAQPDSFSQAAWPGEDSGNELDWTAFIERLPDQYGPRGD